ncbi:hypothetical protein PHMEG_00026796 [Phytophthora megakarya]|uniref:PiggyBac transposable element-derived protein domain-containing protein n=1 Tax=Phytophthora megakarya TaxID=4795 RepID=A0A225V8R1_9STRA|nr:hypothetical protein PHMEG_00026796 [Phytophthora megakarya]
MCVRFDHGANSGGEDEDVMAEVENDKSDDEESRDDNSSSSESEDEAVYTFETTEDGLRALTAGDWSVYDAEHSCELQMASATDRYNGPWGPIRSALAFTDSPLGLFFYFLPNKLWLRTAEESNRYRTQMLAELFQERRENTLKQQAKDPRKAVPTLEDIEAEFGRFQSIKPYKLVHVIGLLMGCALAPIRDGLSKHWATTEDGAVPRGTFNNYMKRERFESIARFHHLNDNEAAETANDRAWKVRPALQVIEKTFRRGYRLGKEISFDEGVVPNRSRFNPIKVYMKDKPSKWGTKFNLRVVRRQRTVLVWRFTAANQQKARSRQRRMWGRLLWFPNISKVLRGQSHKRLTVTPNYYTSIQLSINLLSMELYHVGTIRKQRLGWCPEIEFIQKRGPKHSERTVLHRTITYVPKHGRARVNMIATGRTQREGPKHYFTSCPQLVVDYAKGMEGVDVHDQLHLQRYSLQKCIAFKKYYKRLFLGIVDIACVNGLIVHNIATKRHWENPTTHAAYLCRQHKKLLALREDHLDRHPVAEDLGSGPVGRGDHTLIKTTSRYHSETEPKRRQPLCKVCSAFTSGKSYETSYFGPTSSETFDERVPLCPKIRRMIQGNTLTCTQIWHDVWNDSRNISPHLNAIRFRKPKRKRSERNE